MRKSTKIFLISSALILLAAGCNKPQATSQQSSGNQQLSTPNTQTQTKDNIGGPDYSPNSNPKASTVTVKQTVEGSNLNQSSYTVEEGQKAIILLKASHKVETKTYSGIGEFVESIDGIKPDSKHFWEFFINGKSSQVGASDYTLKNGDVIEWKLTAINATNGQ